jgi:hypothetical protein
MAMRRREFIAALLIALVASFGFWYYRHIAVDPPVSKNVDLSELFKSGPNETMGAGDFLELPDPACTKSFSLELTQPAFIRISRNCRYSLYVDVGRVSANFLNQTKGSVELAPGRSWTARDFWSITPLEQSAHVRLEPAR